MLELVQAAFDHVALHKERHEVDLASQLRVLHQLFHRGAEVVRCLDNVRRALLLGDPKVRELSVHSADLIAHALASPDISDVADYESIPNGIALDLFRTFEAHVRAQDQA